MVKQTKAAGAASTNAPVAGQASEAAPASAAVAEGSAASREITDASTLARAGDRPQPSPAAEAAAAIAEAPVDPRPGSGSLDTGVSETRFEGLSNAEILSLNAYLALVPAGDLALFRAHLAQVPVDPVKGQGSLDDRRPGSLAEAFGGVAPLSGLARARETSYLTHGQSNGDMRLVEQLDPEEGPWLRIRSTRDGHRRGGRTWSTAPVFVSEHELTFDQLEQILVDATMIVERV